MGKSWQGKAMDGSMAISEALLDGFKVAAVPGLPFGAEGFLRMSFVTSRANIEKGLQRLREFASALG
jgi:aspartate aminotransferase